MAKSGVESARERKERGLCCSCSNQATHGVRCEDCAKKASEKAAARYQAKKAAGMCGMCGKNPRQADKECCQSCIDKQNERRKANDYETKADDPTSYYQKRKDAGLCGMCGKNPKPEDGIICSECRERQNKARRVENPRPVFDKPYHQRNKEAGLCMLGGEGHDKPLEGYSVCESCRQKRRELRQKRKDNNQCPTCARPTERKGLKCEFCRQRVKQNRLDNIAKGLCQYCGKCPPKEECSICEGCLLKLRVKSKRRRDRIKEAVFQAYGGYKCACCGETEILFLQIDHVNNDGAAHRKLILGGKAWAGHRTYQWLRDNNYPPGFQVLCSNCNHGKARNNGICPHQQKKESLLPSPALTE